MTLSPAEIEPLVDRHYAHLFRFALSLARNEAEAADLTQQTFFRLASRGGQIRDLDKAKSWLFTTLYREFLELRRHASRFTSMDADETDGSRPRHEPTVPPEVVRRTDAGLVLEALGQVSEVFRVPLSLFYIDSLSYREIAAVLDVPIGTVMSRLSRGKEELRQRLGDSISAADAAGKVIPIRRASND